MEAQIRAFVSLFSVPGSLPADTVILAIFAPAICNSDKIYQTLILAQALEDDGKLGILIANDHGLRVFENRVDVLDHEPRNVRNAVEDEVAIGPDQAGHLHVLVKNAQIVAFADEMFDDFDHGALAQIVGSRLKTKTQYPDAPVAGIHDHLQPGGNLHLVA